MATSQDLMDFDEEVDIPEDIPRLTRSKSKQMSSSGLTDDLSNLTNSQLAARASILDAEIEAGKANNSLLSGMHIEFKPLSSYEAHNHDAAAGAEDTGAGGDPHEEAEEEVPSNQRELSIIPLSQESIEEEQEEEEEEKQDYEEEMLKKKSQVELEKMLVDVKADIALCKAGLDKTGKKVLREMLRNMDLNNEEVNKLNTLLTQMNNLTSKELKHFNMVVSMEVRRKVDLPAELANLECKASSVEAALDTAMLNKMKAKRGKLEDRVAAKVDKALASSSSRKRVKRQ